MLSIITVTFQDYRGLEATLKSVRDSISNLGNFEIIVVDGDPQTNFDYQSFQDLPIKTIIGKDRGVYDAMNIGVSAASGRYLWFLNGGDTLSYFEGASTINDSNATLLLGGYTRGDKRFLVPNERQFRNRCRSGRMPHSHQAILFLAEALEPAPYSLSLKISSDYKLILALAADEAHSIETCAFEVHCEAPGLSGDNFLTGLLERTQIRTATYGFSILFFVGLFWRAVRHVMGRNAVWPHLSFSSHDS